MITPMAILVSNKAPTTPNMIGENDDAEPINPVRFMFPKLPSRKSIIPSPINIILKFA